MIPSPLNTTPRFVASTRSTGSTRSTSSTPSTPRLRVRFLRSLPTALFALSVLFGSAAPAVAQRGGISDADIAALAQSAPAAGRGGALEPTGMGATLARMGLSLVAVFGLIFLVAWLARKYLPPQIAPGRAHPIEVISTRSIGPRRSLMLVRVRDKTVLLGVTPQSMQFLTDIDCGAAAWEEAAVQSGLDDAASAGERAR